MKFDVGSYAIRLEDQEWIDTIEWFDVFKN